MTIQKRTCKCGALVSAHGVDYIEIKSNEEHISKLKQANRDIIKSWFS